MFIADMEERMTGASFLRSDELRARTGPEFAEIDVSFSAFGKRLAITRLTSRMLMKTEKLMS